MAVATATPHGAPSVRMVLLKEVDERGVAPRQAGHSATMALDTYGHVFDELDAPSGSPRNKRSGRRARNRVRPWCDLRPIALPGRRAKPRGLRGFRKSPLTDSNRRPPPYHGSSQATVADGGNGFGLFPPSSGAVRLRLIATGCNHEAP